VRTYGLDGTPHREINFAWPGHRARALAGHSNDRETFYSFTDLITAPTVYRYDMGSGRSTVFGAPKVAFNPSSLVERQVFYPGKDGTRIPMLLAYRKGLKLDGQKSGAALWLRRLWHLDAAGLQSITDRLDRDGRNLPIANYSRRW